MQRNLDRRIALVVAALAAAVFALTWTFPPTPPALVEGMDPASYPRLICTVILLLAAVLLVQPGSAGEKQPPLGRVFWMTIATCVAYVVAIYFIGMLAAGLLLLIGLGWLWGERRWPVLLASAAGTMAAVWLVFVRGFGIPLPLGVFGD